MIIAFVIAILFAFMFLFLCTIYKQDRLIKRLKKELADKDKSVTYYRNVIEGFCQKMEDEERKYEILSAIYCTSDSDLIKYKTEKAMENAINSRLALLIGNDIQKWIAPSVLPLENGNKKYSYVFKVRRV